MKITAAAGDIARALAIVGIGVMKRTAGVSAVHIAAANGEVSLCSQFLELAVAAKAIATIVEPGNAATSAMPLINLIGGLPPAATVTLSATDTWVSVSCGHHRSRLVAMPWVDMPSMIDIEDETGTLEISGADCLALLEPLPAAGGERSRFYLNGIHWSGGGGRIGAVATDGIRMIITSIAAGPFSEGTSDLILPRDAAAALLKLIKAAKPDLVTLRRSKRLIGASCFAFSFISKLVDAQFPDIRPVIPAPSSNAAVVKLSHLKQAIESLEVVGSLTDKSPLLLLHFDGRPKLHLGLARQLADGTDIIEADDTIGHGKAVVQLRLLIDMLGQVSGEHVRLEFNENRPLRLIGDGDKLILLSQCHWDFETEKRPASAR
jgi:DNA polymerase III subunit beta